MSNGAVVISRIRPFGKELSGYPTPTIGRTYQRYEGREPARLPDDDPPDGHDRRQIRIDGSQRY